MRATQTLLFAAFLWWAAMTAAEAQTAQAPASPTIEPGSTVRIEYTLKDDTGAVLDTNKGESPITYTQGEQQIIPALERQLTGLHAGDEKKVVLKPEEAYGTVDPAAQTEVAKELLPQDALGVGKRLMARDASGEERPVTIKEVKDKTVVLDLNHPLAGKTLSFDIKVLGVDPPKAAEAKPAEAKPAEGTPPAPSPTESKSPQPSAAEPKPAETQPTK
jgi:FKBP-type peptidyl-prolyl cis-trans isomerase SlyD